MPQFVKPENNPEGNIAPYWREIHVEWPPRGTRRFAVGQEQFFDWPECDAFCFDDTRGTEHDVHTWSNEDGVWSKAEGAGNLMLRVVAGYYGAVSPTSLGRIKALYQ